ncbi:MAG: chromosomal replication initiator protein DnaA, partial [Candidatus Omnitrophica bacterium]|nr:chromosomal replication initiator protein DnaA [Candidatus Omnitrophota bacterium]
YYRVNEVELLKRKKKTERQRKIAIYLCKVLSGRKNVEVGRTFGITLQAVTNAVRAIERMKEEDKKINKEIEAIKERIRND